MKLQKFENVDVIASLEAIMKQNTAFYQSDFDIDKQILRKAAVSLIPEDKRLLWFSRPSGTCCFRERDVFLKDTFSNFCNFIGQLLSKSCVFCLACFFGVCSFAALSCARIEGFSCLAGLLRPLSVFNASSERAGHRPLCRQLWL